VCAAKDMQGTRRNKLLPSGYLMAVIKWVLEVTTLSAIFAAVRARWSCPCRRPGAERRPRELKFRRVRERARYDRAQEWADVGWRASVRHVLRSTPAGPAFGGGGAVRD
jgi:hypothetical protein